MDRLTSLTVFVRVVDCSGFSAAARRLNMSTTMVSSHVQALEDRLGARLLNRTTRKVSLTEVGRTYYDRCTQILAELEEADRLATAIQSTPRGTLRLYTATAIVRFIAPVVAEYLALYPDASVELTTGERMVDLVEEGIDLAIRPTPPPDSSLIVRRLATWRHALCCSPGYLEAHAPPVRLSDLADHNFLRFAFYPFDEWRFTGPGGEPASVRVSGNLLATSAETLRIAALSSRGVFLAPGFVIAEDLEAGRLVPILPEYRPIEFAIHAIYPHRHHLSAKVRGFIDLLAERIVEHRRWMDPDIPISAASAAQPA
jgi:DNA-binding transcriptional LysR family regulator